MLSKISSALAIGQPKGSHDRLRKTPEGSNYAKWLDKLREDFALNSAVVVKQYGPDIVDDQGDFQTQFALDYMAADEYEKVGLLKKKAERQNAVEIIFNLIMSKLSEEVKQLVEADTQYVEMRDKVSSRGPFRLLAVIRKVVNSGLTSDDVYQTMVNVKALHEVKQNQNETIVAYVERLKGARDAFLSTSPHGLLFKAPDMSARVVTVDSLSGFIRGAKNENACGYRATPATK